MISRTFGHYKIIEKIGAGGMGEVYRALDTRLDREIAIKILPEGTSDPERLKRFEREARTVAALKHPNIVTIHSVEEIDGRSCLTMELVDGKTLAELIPAGGLLLERFFELAIPLSEALIAAHTRGITHRDLKPPNVMVDADGTLKVLDFGLAKLFAAPDGSEDATFVGEESVTGEGRVLGTVYYMSPEQAEAKPLDQRSDIFSLGVVLYEMATGKRPFAGDTPISTISSILKDTPPPVTEVRENLPRHLARVVNRCLEKNPDKRFQTARDVANELEGLQKEVESGDIEQAITASMSRSSLDVPWHRRGGAWPLIAGAIVIAAAAGAFFFGKRSRTAPELELSTRPMTSMVGVEIAGSWSPDGGFFAYAHSMSGPLDIFVVSASGGDPIKLVESPYDDISPRWSPDNRWVAFVSGRNNESGIYIVPPLGGQIQKVVETGMSPLSLQMQATLGSNPWSPDGRTLLFARNDDSGITRIWTIDFETRNETPLDTQAGPDESDSAPTYSRAGDQIAFCRSDNTSSRLMVMPAGGGRPEEFLVTDNEQEFTPCWAPDGETIVYGGWVGGVYTVNVRSGKARQVTTGETLGMPIVARDGRILYSTSTHQTDLYVQDIDDGSTERLTLHTKDNFTSSFSPDGSQVAYMSSRTGNQEIWLLDRNGGSERQLTNREAGDWSPDWSPDGRVIVFASLHGGTRGIWIASVEGGALRKLGDHVPRSDPHWSPDGSMIGFVGYEEGTPSLFVIDPGGGNKRKVLDGVQAFDWYPDSKHIIYSRLEGARTEMWVGNIETGETAVLLATPFVELSVAPDGSAVSYCSALSHYNMNLHVLPLNPPDSPGGLPTPAGPPRAITHGDGEWHVHNGGWSPDSKQVIYTRDTDTGDIYLLEGAL